MQKNIYIQKKLIMQILNVKFMLRNCYQKNARGTAFNDTPTAFNDYPIAFKIYLQDQKNLRSYQFYQLLFQILLYHKNPEASFDQQLLELY
jgi:hypothetical protein